ncbi:HAD family hydrolase [Arthrobacter glacialis]|uniref:HAD family hydrolase n=1 Tax=Arthrobacter glacialis TaxID=1664 RepID=UPI000CD4416B|nr:HAD family phosphatase [Arthrobacter glacialis]POH58343.1 HAD family phosphatase [Arthrobacter glacialis]
MGAVTASTSSTLSNSTLLELDGVLFDFNGTLSDDEGVLRDLFIDLAATECGVAITARQYQEELAGRSDREIMTDILALAPDEPRGVEAFLPMIDTEYKARVARESLIRPATRELVHALHAAGLKLGVVTGASRLQVIPALERAGLLELFGVVVTDDDVAEGKPNPEGFLRAARTLGLEHMDKVAAFEDSVPGLGAVAAAGMIAICVEGTHPKEVLEQHASIIIAAITPACLDLRRAQSSQPA